MISRQENNTQRIAALDEQASALKLKPGMGIADARAMYPAIEVVGADPDADRNLLEALADWCDRYTPLVALDGRDGLFLDVTGCAHLFGGEETMLGSMLERFFEQGFVVRAGLAATPGAAWAIARFSMATAILRESDERAFLQDLPLAALRLEPDTIARLESVGLNKIGMIADMPRAPLTRRFGAMLLWRLDQAFGEIEDVISPRLPVPDFSVEKHFAEPVMLMEHIEVLVRQLAASLKRELDQHGEGARHFELLLFRVDGAVTRVVARASLPLSDPATVHKLFQERLAAVGAVLEPGYGFDLIRLAAFEASRIEAFQADFHGGSRTDGEDVVLFTDRVRARLGYEAIRVSLLKESHLPEQVATLAPRAYKPGEILRGKREVGAPSFWRTHERPLRLFDRPEPIDVPVTQVPEGPPINFRWRSAMHRVLRAEGPERIGPEWWCAGIPVVDVKKEKDREEAEREAVAAETARLTRDYFQVEDMDGRRFWLYREGLYGAETSPRWFMQGLFA